MSEKTQKNYQVPNLERGMAILQYLSKQQSGKTQTQLVEALGYPTNSIYRITMALQEMGYLERDLKTKAFSLTDKLLSIGSNSICEHSVIELALPEMRKIRDITKETVLIGTLIPSEARGISIEQVPGLHPFKFLFDSGSNLLLHVGAPGKALLAHLPEGEREILLDQLCYEGFTKNTLTTKEALKENIEECITQGYFTDNGEWMEEMHCVGHAVLNSQGYPVAAIWVTGPSSRLKKRDFKKVGKLIRESCQSISEALGYQAPS